MSDSSHILNDEAFKDISPQKLKIMVDMLNDMTGKPMEQKVRVLFSYGVKMKQKGLQFTKQESSLIIDSMKSNLSPTDRNKLDMVVTMMEMM
ncbi:MULTISPECIES: hypothetical protein [Vallitalea]|uniref:Uncharacterized protein n=2 Tax=Vallitalea TaxID=1348611 RepID=A0A8J8SAP1_9FIRM|nr:hypothetical protein [Vallitalea guaymasensis]QUH27476.1 hypothetical protein HYG85_00480 [Vallitalea guaymasensis]GMQ61295.1 hypothetical protein AN2V17_05230 [Vallitalea sp. AN17-2]